jgi:hypothetical protein
VSYGVSKFGSTKLATVFAVVIPAFEPKCKKKYEVKWSFFIEPSLDGSCKNKKNPEFA